MGLMDKLKNAAGKAQGAVTNTTAPTAQGATSQTTNVRFCTNCGNQLNEGAVFCTNCGNSVTGASAQTQSFTRQEFIPDFGLGKRTVFTENSLIHGDVEYPYAQLGQVAIYSPPSMISSGSALMVTNDGKEVIISFQAKDMERLNNAMTYANEQIDLAKGITKNYKYLLPSPTGSKLEVYDDYFILHYITSEAGGMMSAASDKVSGIGGGLGKGLGKLIEGVGGAATAIGNISKGGGVAGSIIMFENLSAFQLNADSLIVNEYSLPISPQNMELARQIVNYVRETLNSEKSDIQEQAEEQELWEPVKGTARAFPLCGGILEVSESMDIFNTYRQRFWDLAEKHTAKVEAEYNKKVRDLMTFMEFFPRMYGRHMAAMAQKAVDILVAESVWTVTFDSFLEEHTEGFHLAFDVLEAMVESISLTAEANAQGVASLTSFIPNLVGGGFGVKGAVKGIAMAQAFNFVRDGLEEKAVNNAMNLNPAQKQELYQRIESKDLFGKVFFDYCSVYLSLIWTLNENGRAIWDSSGESYQQAGNIFKNLSNPNFPKDKTVEVFLQILGTYPYDAQYYKYAISRFGDTEEVATIRNYFGYADFNRIGL